MANYNYKARDRFSKLVSGSLVSETKEDASKRLREMGYIPVSIVEAYDLGAERFLKKFRHVTLSELSTFTRQLYSMQKAGVPLLSSLEAIAQQTKNKYFKLIIEETAVDIKAGLAFSQSLEKHPKIFSNVYASMIKAAEAGGVMTDILERLTQLIEHDIETRQQIKAATRYPMIAFGVLCVGFLIVVTFVIPRFAGLYSQFNAILPLPTRILIALNVAIQKYWYLFILLIAAAIYGFIRFINSKLGRPIWDNFKLKVPVFGQLFALLIMSRFARVTSILMKSGVPILEVLDLVSQTSENVIIGRAIASIKESVNQGRGMSEPMKVSNLFPPLVIQMVAIGEESGKVEELLLSVADYYDRESAYMIKNLTTYIEPILIFILGVMVLVMALAIFMPMWNLIKVFKPG